MAISIGQSALVQCNLVISQGATNTYAFRYSISSDGAVAAVDMSSGWTARAQVRKKVGGDIMVDLTDTDGISLGADGSIVVTIIPTDTEGIVTSGVVEGVWDLELQDPSGAVVRFAEGKTKMSPDVTRES